MVSSGVLLVEYSLALFALHYLKPACVLTLCEEFDTIILFCLTIPIEPTPECSNCH